MPLTPSMRAAPDLTENTSAFDVLFRICPIPLAMLRLEDGGERRVERLNPAFIDLTGYDQSDLATTEDWWRLAFPDPATRETARSLWLERVTQAVANGQTAGPLEFAITCKDGSVRHIEAHMAALGERLLGAMVDVTPAKTSLRQMQESEALFRAIAETAQDYIFCKDRERRYTFTNTAMQGLLGCSAADLLGKTPLEVFGEEEARIVAEVDDPVFTGKITDAVRCMRIGEETRTLHTIQAPICDADGGITGICGIVRDVTREKQAEQELENQASFTSECPTPILRVSSGGVLAYANAASDRLLRTWDCSVGDPLPSAYAATAAAALRDGLVKHAELECEGVIYSLAFAPVGGRHVNVYAQDVTEGRRLQKQLRQAEKMHAIGELAGGIAHDFNNQLAGIMGYAEILEQRLGGGAHGELAGKIHAVAGSAANLIAQLLAFSRRGQFRTVPVDVHAIASEVMHILKHSIDKRIRIHSRLEAPQAIITGDPAQIQSALLNLAVNARDAMPDGGDLTFATTCVVLEADAALVRSNGIVPGDYLVLSVSDSGMGMSPEIQARIFEPFFTTKGKDKGTGLGLASVYGTMHMHRGAVSVSSEPGRGSTFSLHLPLSESPAAMRTDGKADMRPAADALRILVIDDQDPVRDVATEMLQDLGYAVTAFASGPEALAFYRQHGAEVALIILDLVMPQMCGRDVFHALRAIRPDARVILASGYSMNGEVQRILEQGALGFLQKPFKFADLSEQINGALALR